MSTIITLRISGDAHPFRINALTCKVEDQDHWKGDPLQLLGFQAAPDVQAIKLFDDRFVEDPQRAVGMYPVFSRAAGIVHHDVPVLSVEVEHDDTPDSIAAVDDLAAFYSDPE